MDSILHELGRHQAEKYLRGRRAARVLAACVALILAVQLSACDGGSGGSRGGGGGAQQAPQDYGAGRPGGSAPAQAPYTGGPPVTTAASIPDVPQVGCTPKWPRRQRPVANAPEEVEYLDLIVACVNDSTGSVSLTNKSNMVWVFQADSPVSIYQEEADLKVKEFHALALAGMYSLGFMAPTETIYVNSPPDSFEWVIHPDLSLAWMTNELVLKQVIKKTTAALKSAFTSGSAVRKAVWDCTKAVYDVAVKVPQILSPQYDPAGLLKQGLGIATSSGTCGMSWAAAEKEVAASAPLPSFVQVSEEARIASRGTGEFAEKSGVLLRGIKALARPICRATHRCAV
jgi:hypothetical protein